jgi:LacI family transcriptional regulator
MNLEDIAKKAGVSRSTVSRVVNGDVYVSEKTRTKVLKVISEENYTPNPAARMLVTQRSQVIGAIVPNTPGFIFDDSFYFPNLLHGISQATNECDYGLLMWMGENTNDEERFSRRVLHNRLVDGLVLASTLIDSPLLDQLIKSGMTFVMVERPARYAEQISYVTVDNVEAARTATRHLIDLGRTRVATITGSLNNIDAVDRLTGYKLALEQSGCRYDETLVQHGHYTRRGGYEAMCALLPHQPDAVFIATDQMALGALRALQEEGVRVPDDIAIIGFDDLPIASSTTPPLTTIRQPVFEKGHQVAALLIDLIEQKVPHPQHIILPTTLVVRESCGAAPEGGGRTH